MPKMKMLHDLTNDPIMSWSEWQRVWNGTMSFEMRMGLLHHMFSSVPELTNAHSTFDDDLDRSSRICFLLALCEDFELRRDRRTAFSPRVRRQAYRVESLYRKVQSVLAQSIWPCFDGDQAEIHHYFPPVVIKALASHFRLDTDLWRPVGLPDYASLTRDSRTEKAWWDFASKLATFPLKWARRPTYPDDGVVEVRHQELFDHRGSLMHIIVAAGKSQVFLDHVGNLSNSEITYLESLATRGGLLTNLESVAAFPHVTPERELARTLIVIEGIRGMQRLPDM